MTFLFVQQRPNLPAQGLDFHILIVLFRVYCQQMMMLLGDRLKLCK